MTNFSVTIFASEADLTAALELIDNTVSIQVIAFMERGKQKFMLIQ